MDESKHNKCDQIREQLIELVDRESIGVTPGNSGMETLLVDGESAKEHVENCSACRIWKDQTLEMIDVAHSLPQFDVSESLTQSILRGVEQEDRVKQHRLAWVVYGSALSLFLYVLLFGDAYESVWGIGSWIVGLGTMIVLKMIVTEHPKKERQVI
ncbi:MAG: hypothetical protein SGJ27_04945 [Candidatus Melainabacteria bacterium]|nr:hypothetical protein [Candidatus Melainabacteria bacterium]